MNIFNLIGGNMYLSHDKIIIFICCISLYLLEGGHSYEIIPVLIAILVTSLNSYFDDRRIKLGFYLIFITMNIKSRHNVNIKFPSNPTDPLSLPAAGKATVGIYYQPDVIIARANEKVPVKSIGSIVQSPLNVIIALKEKGINSPKDLSGKTIGFSGNPLNTEYVKTMVKEDDRAPTILERFFYIREAMTSNNIPQFWQIIASSPTSTQTYYRQNKNLGEVASLDSQSIISIITRPEYLRNTSYISCIPYNVSPKNANVRSQANSAAAG